MTQAEIEAILSELDAAYEEVKAARRRLTELLPASATKPGDSGHSRVEFVTGLPSETEEHGGAELIRKISAEAWEQAQKALVNATEKVELAHHHLRKYLSH